MPRTLAILGLVCLVLGFLGQAFPVEVVDDRGKAILVPKEPERIVVAGIPLYAEILVDLGLSGRIVGVADSPDLPPELLQTPRVGPAFAPSLEAIIALAPDVVFGAWGEVRDRLESLGIPVVTGGGPEGWIQGIVDVFEVILLVGRTVGQEKEAQLLVGRLAQEIVAVEGILLDRARTTAAFLYLASPGAPPYAAGLGTPEHELLIRAGGENVFPFPGYAQISLEEVILRDPTVIFTDPAQVQNFFQSLILTELAAVKGGRVVGIPASWLVSTRVARALRKMAEALHPEVFGP